MTQNMETQNKETIMKWLSVVQWVSWTCGEGSKEERLSWGMARMMEVTGCGPGWVHVGGVGSREQGE